MAYTDEPISEWKTFIKVTEVWIPNRERDQLELHSGIYGHNRAFGTYSKQQTFTYGEGLPGVAWKKRMPIILPRLNQKNFKRYAQAQAIGLDCGMAFPVFAGEVLMGVVVFLCSHDENNSGAIEIWHIDPENEGKLIVGEGYYGSLKEFEFFSRQARIAFGNGLPGKVWQYQLPILCENLATNSEFIRASLAADANLTTALGLPCINSPESTYILCILSSKNMPIAGRYEIWGPDQGRKRLVLLDAAGEDSSRHFAAMKYIRIKCGKGIIGKTWSSGLPRAEAWFEQDGTEPIQAAIEAGFDHMVSVPIYLNGYLSSVVTWYF